ncbi:MAG: DUF4458 domain-containing protein [Bacteroidaceae bacterium]|nr:DUF4458 domain-containing protein [Bacteroidaceae bacterium]
MKNKNSYLLLFIAVLLTTIIVGCSTKDSYLDGEYGYAQFRVCKSASYEPVATTKAASSGSLNLLSEANKITVVLQCEGDVFSQTLLLNSYNLENAEFGLRSDKLQLLAGEYTIIGYYLYDRLDQQIMSGTLSDNKFSVIAGGLLVKDVPVDAQPRGLLSFRLIKDILKTRAEESEAYTFDKIKAVDISVKNTFTQEVTTFEKIKVKYTEDFKEGCEDDSLYPGKNAETAYGECDTILWIAAGEYTVSGYTTYSDKKAKLSSMLEAAQIKDGKTFVVEDNVETKDVEVPVKLYETSEYIKDYIALKELWLALDGKNWSYRGEAETHGCNWNFNKDIDMWGDQPGVQLDNDGRIETLSLDGMGAKGVVPDAIGQLTALKILSFGSHSEVLGGHLIENFVPNMSDEQKMAARYDYENLVLKKDFRLGLSAMWQKTLEAEEDAAPLQKGHITLKNIQFGELTNRITGISKAMMRLVNLEQFYIANSPIEHDSFFREIEPSSPFSAEKDTLSWGNLKNLVDVEIYNCPNLKALPVEFLTKLPELQQLNVACSKGVSGEQLKRDWEALIDGDCGPKLQLLYLGYNNLVEFPDSVQKMKKLSLLDCTNNQIETLKPFGKNVNLAKIYLSYNKIKEIPKKDGYFCGYEQLESFNCNNNKLEKFPNIFNANSIYVGQSIDFSYNNISEFEDGDNFKGLNISQVNLSNNKLEKFPSILFKKHSPMTYLILAGNGMKEIPDSSMVGKNAYMLEALDLSYNYLKKLSDDFYAVRLPYLTGLDLSYNRFSEFPYAPLSISSLQRLIIRHQRDEKGNRCLKEWPTGIYRCPSLAIFCIGSNDIRKVDDTISPYISYLEVADNPNITLDVSSVCDYIAVGYYQLFYDKTQDIRGCSALKLEN